MRLVLPTILRLVLVAFLAVSSAAILYATVMNERTVESLADRSLESTALSLSAATESALRAGRSSSPALLGAASFSGWQLLVALSAVWSVLRSDSVNRGQLRVVSE